MSFTVRYDDNNQELMLAGSMSPQSAGDLADFRKIFEKSIAAVSGTLYFNVKRLLRLNNIAFHELASLVS
jgi:hypothetical protein